MSAQNWSQKASSVASTGCRETKMVTDAEPPSYEVRTSAIMPGLGRRPDTEEVQQNTVALVLHLLLLFVARALADLMSARAWAARHLSNQLHQAATPQVLHGVTTYMRPPACLQPRVCITRSSPTHVGQAALTRCHLQSKPKTP